MAAGQADRANSHAVTAMAEALCAAGRRLAARGWLPATSGNLSGRVDGASIAVTLSGRDKGALVPADIVSIPQDAPPPAGVSAETPLHLSLYRRWPGVGAVLHIHSLAATVASQRAAARGEIVLEGYEMLKALSGIATHETAVTLPVFANDQDVPALAARVENRLADKPGHVGYLLAGHGLYAWGASVEDAMRHVEALDFLLTCELEKERLLR
jgi:methylthioribulose-1-phosphate dehydratase